MRKLCELISSSEALFESFTTLCIKKIAAENSITIISDVKDIENTKSKSWGALIRHVLIGLREMGIKVWSHNFYQIYNTIIYLI